MLEFLKRHKKSLAIAALATSGLANQLSAATVTYKDDVIGGYDDSFQTMLTTERKPIGFGVYVNAPVLKVRSLRHELHLVVTGPDADGLRNKALQCLAQATTAGLVAAAGSGPGVGVGALVTFLGTCVANDAVQVHIEDHSHWTDWHNP